MVKPDAENAADVEVDAPATEPRPTRQSLGRPLTDAELELALEAVIFASGEPIDLATLLQAFIPSDAVDATRVETALQHLAAHYAERSLELTHTANGYRFRVRKGYSDYIQATQPERPPRLSRALLETLAIIAYRQPVTRAEIESIRGVAVSTSIMRNLLEREWVHSVGHKDVPGRPALYATTRTFLDDVGLQRLDELPPLDALRDLAEQAAEQENEDL